MNNTIAFVKWLVACLTGMLLLTACTKEKDLLHPPAPERPVTIQFAQDEQSAPESAAEIAVQLVLSEAAKKAEQVVVSVSSATAQYGADFTTEPAAVNGQVRLAVPAGESNATLVVKPVNNNRREAARQLLLQLAEGGTLKPGTRKQSKIILQDDEGSSTVAFSSRAHSISENNGNGYEVELTVAPAAAAGFVELDLTLTNAVYGQHFTTVPAAVNNKLTLPVAAGSHRLAFRVQPVDDAVQNGARTLVFRMGRLSQDLIAGEQNSFRLTITDNDAATPAPTSIASLRAGYNGTPTYFWANVYISGTVTSVVDNIGPTTAFIEDGSGGIALQFVTAHGLQPGDVVTVDLQGAELARGAYGLSVRQLATSVVQRTGSEIFVVPETSLADLYGTTTSREGQLVVLRNLRFTEANGSLTYEGTRTVSDGQRSAMVRTSSTASYRNNVLPAQAVSITGILVKEASDYIILPLTGSSIQ